MLLSSSYVKKNSNDMFKKGKHQSEIILATKIETEDPGIAKRKEICHSRDGTMIKGKDHPKPEKLKKQDLIMVKAATDLVPEILTNRHDQGRLLTP